MDNNKQKDFIKAIEELLKKFSNSKGIPSGKMKIFYESRDGNRFRIEIEDDNNGDYKGKIIVWDKNGNGDIIFDGKITDGIWSNGGIYPISPFVLNP